MRVTVAETPIYSSQAATLLSETERELVVNMISSAPLSGALMPGTGGLRRIRIGLEGRGKRGGGRVIYWFHSPEYPAVLLWVLAKNAASDLTAEQAKKVKRLSESFLKDFGGKR